MTWENPVTAEIRLDIASVLNEMGLKPEELTADGRLAVIIPRGRAMVLDLKRMAGNDFDHVLVLTNDALSLHVQDENWEAILDVLRKLQAPPDDVPVAEAEVVDEGPVV